MPRRARLDPRLVAILSGLAPLRYDDGGALSEDRPGHVRGASAVVRQGRCLVIVQDDVHVLAVRDGAGRVSGVLLPAGRDGVRTFDEQRGNKQAKLDLEACVVLGDGRLVAFGSGSTPARERLVVLDPDGRVALLDASRLYARLREDRDFSGGELNLEGAIVTADRLRIFQRGNGTAREDVAPGPATADLALDELERWISSGGDPPAIRDVVRYDLGSTASGIRFGFTDAAPLDGGRVAFLAAAEDSPDAYRDGAVGGTRFGIVEGDGEVRTTEVVDGDGRPIGLKLEGLSLRPRGGLRHPSHSPGASSASRVVAAARSLAFDVVVDMDDPDEPARIGLLEVDDRR